MIPNKELTEKQYQDLINFQRLFCGGEGLICETDNPESLYKIFGHGRIPTPMAQTKIKKISELYELNPEHCIKPIRTISLNDIIIGYEMTTKPGLEKASSLDLSYEEKKYFLTKTKEILEYFSSIGIIYGDLAPRNILFDTNTGDIKFCDMDNISIAGIPMELVPFPLQHYEDTKPIDSNVHPYMHNVMSLKTFDLDSYWAKKQDIKRYFKNPAVKIVKSMEKPEQFNNQYIIKYIKK